MIKVSRLVGHCFFASVLLWASLVLTGCQTGNSGSGAAGIPDSNGTQFASASPVAAANPGGENTPSSDTIDSLHAGDVLTIEFSDMPVTILPREERIKEDGTITLLEGKTFVAAGKSRGQLEKEIREWYVPRYYLRMAVSIRQKEQTQFYYVRGEVRIPNRQIYISRIRLLQAIASAGDFTDFARKKSVLLTRSDGRKLTINCLKARKDPTLNVEILPGDIIDVPRRNPIW
jgi:protein involved in polysaccharide export with SLBB domain